MLDQIGLGRTFDGGYLPSVYPFGQGLNGQIEVPNITPLIAALEVAGIALLLTPEDKWYRCEEQEVGNPQFIVAEPHGYLLRFYQSLGAQQMQSDQLPLSRD